MTDAGHHSAVLNVADNAAERDARSEVLERAGYHVVEASCEAEAYQRVAAEPIDVILLDLHAPEGGSAEVAERLKADPATSAVPILRLMDATEQCLLVSPDAKPSADMCLEEPVTPEALLITVGALLRVSRALRETEGQRALLETLLQEVPAGLLVVDRAGRLVLANERLKEMLQLPVIPSDREARREAVVLYSAAGERADLEAFPLQHTLRTGEAVLKQEYSLVGDDGTRRVIRVDSYPIRGPDGVTAAAALAFIDVTERQRIEEDRDALLAEAQRWRTLLDAVLYQMPAAVLVVDAEGNVVLSNERARGIFPHAELTMEQAIIESELTMRRADGTRYRYEELPVLRALRRGETVVGEEFTLVREHYPEAVISANVAPLRDAEGRIAGAVAIFADVTKRSHAEEEREQQARLLKTLIENTDQWLAYLDRGLHFVLTNSAFAAKSPLPPEELAGRHFLEVFPKQTDVYAFYLRARDTGETVSLQEFGTELPNRPDLGRRYITFSIAPVKDGEGNVEGVVLSAQDVTEQVAARERTQRAERAWARQARLLEIIQESVPVGLGYLDRGLRFVQVNSTLAQLVGLPREEVIGAEAAVICPGSNHLIAALAHVRDAGMPFEIREAPRSVEGRSDPGNRYLDIAGFPVMHDTQVEGIVLAVVDVTDRVRQREQLLAAERARADLAHELRDEIAHRVKNNLAMVSGLLQMQALSAPDPQAATALREAVARVRTFVNIHDQMYTSRTEQVKLLEVLRRVAESTREVFAARREVTVSVAGEEMLVPAQAATNLSVVANELLTNALKHGARDEEGRVCVELSLVEREGLLWLTVWNSGNPVAADFDPHAHAGMGMRLLWDVVVSGYHGELRIRPHRDGTLAEVVIGMDELSR